MNNIKDKNRDRDDYYKSLKRGDIVQYHSRVPWEWEYTDTGLITSITEWDDEHDPKRMVSITKLNPDGTETGSQCGCSVFYIKPPDRFMDKHKMT